MTSIMIKQMEPNEFALFSLSFVQRTRGSASTKNSQRISVRKEEGGGGKEEVEEEVEEEVRRRRRR